MRNSRANHKGTLHAGPMHFRLISLVEELLERIQDNFLSCKTHKSVKIRSLLRASASFSAYTGGLDFLHLFGIEDFGTKFKISWAEIGMEIFVNVFFLDALFFCLKAKYSFHYLS